MGAFRSSPAATILNALFLDCWIRRRFSKDLLFVFGNGKGHFTSNSAHEADCQHARSKHGDGGGGGGANGAGPGMHCREGASPLPPAALLPS